jgi:hypothetical protein
MLRFPLRCPSAYKRYTVARKYLGSIFSREQMVYSRLDASRTPSSSQRQRIGDKASLEHQICEITRIPVTALRGNALDEFSVPERMAWMAGRQTTQEEDVAYSLIGIFGVSMEFRYGEGKERALKRLQEEMEEGTASVLFSGKY